ncbi:LacI family DNA-binding transcriptional regulator [Tessaracoccus caeni]|uniref:LacI family DNA-binding transcriptional regulator n=1 Tax=Tessaracoccus caeni TaxID=3031239 RepID=UPI0023DB6776|nr:LacI family DNA-binding transcriptional regulator [Tessaracoccus caeni]MDF1487644.1 LacI family DNA-binding transcriptional regulator [Tessaracoccus caeni]
MAVRLKDVAELAGVSVKTVSNVVNDFPHISEATRAKVLTAIDELGYRPNLSARHLKYGRSGFIALAVPDLVIPYFAELAEKVNQAATRHGYIVLLDITRADPQAERTVLQGVQSRMIDGVIFSPLSLGAGEIEASRMDVPTVFLGERAIPEGVDHVAVDSVAAAKAMTQHLIALGRRRIAVIGRSRGVSTGSVRLEGYRQAMDEAGMRVDRRMIMATETYSREAGRAAMLELLALPTPPDAVFCFNDLMAIGALRACFERGVRVPDDVAVAGFDDILESSFTSPSLTTVAPDMDYLVEQVLTRLIERINGSTAPGERFNVPWKVTLRESTLGRTG